MCLAFSRSSIDDVARGIALIKSARRRWAMFLWVVLSCFGGAGCGGEAPGNDDPLGPGSDASRSDGAEDATSAEDSVHEWDASTDGISASPDNTAPPDAATADNVVSPDAAPPDGAAPPDNIATPDATVTPDDAPSDNAVPADATPPDNVAPPDGVVTSDAPITMDATDGPASVAEAADAPMTTDASDAAACTTDNQCPSSQPHCNTATGQCERTLQSIQVTPPTPMVVFGTMQRFTATGAYSDGSATLLTDLAAWSSSDTAVATISNAAGTHGLASSVGGGTSTITAMYDGVSGSASLTVISDGLVSIVVTPASPAIAVGMTQQFTAIGHNSDSTTMDLTTLVTWNSSATSVATISNGAGMNGFATAWAVGSTTIQANLGSVSGVASLQVTP
jgi:hypothetical protein